jgi:predicted HTH transcriptional regulator
MRISNDEGPGKAALVTQAIEAQLNDRQKQIMKQVLESGSVTRRWCVSQFQIANDTAGRDLKQLRELGLLIAEGKGRSVRYVIGTTFESTDNQPT